MALFNRKSQSLELTEAGARLHAGIDPLIGRIDAVTRCFSHHGGRRIVRTSAPSFFASEMLVPRGSMKHGVVV